MPETVTYKNRTRGINILHIILPSRKAHKTQQPVKVKQEPMADRQLEP